MYRDLVEQQTTTTGTGTYTVSGSVAGRRTFADAYADADGGIPYVVTDGAGGFECGFGTWSEGAGTLARTVVTASSNAGAAVNWAAGTKRIYVSPHTGALYPPVRHDLNAGDVPTDITHPPSAGYGTGSHVYTGSSRWTRAAGGWRAALDRSETETVFSYYGGLLRFGFSSPKIGGYGVGAASEYRTFSCAYGSNTMLAMQTEDATPNYLKASAFFAESGDGNPGLWFFDEATDAYSITSITGTVVAITDDGASGKTWDITFDCSVVGGSPSVLTVRGTPSYTARASWGTTTGWDVVLEAVAEGGGIPQHVGVKITGAAATNISWSGQFQINTAYVLPPE